MRKDQLRAMHAKKRNDSGIHKSDVLSKRRIRKIQFERLSGKKPITIEFQRDGTFHSTQFKNPQDFAGWIRTIKYHNGGKLPDELRKSIVIPNKPYHCQGIPDSRERMSDVKLHRRVMSNYNR